MANILGAFLGGMMPQAAIPQRATISAPKEHMQAVRDYTANMPVGNGWTIKVMPLNQWNGPKQVSEGNPHSPYAYSDLGSRVTYLRGTIFHDLPPVAIQRVLAHELGHLTLNSPNEGKANSWADNWFKQNK